MYGYVYRTLLVAVILVALVVYVAYRVLDTGGDTGQQLTAARDMDAPAVKSTDMTASPDASGDAVRIIPAQLPSANGAESEGWFNDADADEVIIDEPRPEDDSFLVDTPQPFSAAPEGFNDSYSDNLPDQDAPFDASPIGLEEGGWAE